MAVKLCTSIIALKCMVFIANAHLNCTSVLKKSSNCEYYEVESVSHFCFLDIDIFSIYMKSYQDANKFMLLQNKIHNVTWGYIPSNEFLNVDVRRFGDGFVQVFVDEKPNTEILIQESDMDLRVKGHFKYSRDECIKDTVEIFETCQKTEEKSCLQQMNVNSESFCQILTVYPSDNHRNITF